MFNAAADKSGSRALAATSALVVGLVAGFAGGYLAGQRDDGSVSSSSTTEVVDESEPAGGLDLVVQSYTENPVTEAVSSTGTTALRPSLRSSGNPNGGVSGHVARAGVATPPASRAFSMRPAVPARTGTLVVVSRPAGAEVFVDDRLAGRTPLSLSQVSIGRHAVRIALPGHRRWATTVNVAAGASARVAASLER